MFFLNLSLPEFLGLLGGLGGVLVTLYLLDRSRRKRVVATLRFVAGSGASPERSHRRRLHQPWSLLLQLVGVALLLLALAQVRFGHGAGAGRDHVLLLDTSAWMSARSGGGRLIGRARAAARSYVRSLPSADRVMVVRADAAATPATPFTSDRAALIQAIDGSQPGATMLNVDPAIAFAQEARGMIEAQPGETVFIGAGRIGAGAASNPAPANLRFVEVDEPPNAGNIGLRKLTARRSPTEAADWEILASARNYGPSAKPVSLALFFDGAPVASRSFVLPSNEERSETFLLRGTGAGRLEARLSPADVFPADNSASIELPSLVAFRVAVYSNDPGPLRAVFGAIPGVAASFEPPSRYGAGAAAGVVVLDRFAPPRPPAVGAIWIQPPADGSPVPVAQEATRVKLISWRSDHPLGAGLHTSDLELETSLVFRPAAGDIRVAESEEGPLIVARPGPPSAVVFGFDPFNSRMRYQLAAPLLFANVLRWLAPGIFRRLEISARAPGEVSVALDAEPDPAAVHVADGDGRPLPFTLDGKTLRFFSGAPGIVQVTACDRELVYSLTLPAPGDVLWRPERARRGLPIGGAPEPPIRDIWQMLALLGGAAFLADWLLFRAGAGSRRFVRSLPGAQPPKRPAWRRAS